MKHLWRLFLQWLRAKWEARRTNAAQRRALAERPPGVTKPPDAVESGGAASPAKVDSHESEVVNAGPDVDYASEWAEFESDPRMQARFRAAWLKHERRKARGEVP